MTRALERGILKAMQELVLGGVCFTVEKKRIKNMYLRVQPPDGRVLLTAPKRMPDAAIEQFARARLPWVQRHLAQFGHRPAPRYESGEILYLWGKPYPLEVVPADGRMRIELHGGSILLFAPEDSTSEKRSAALENWYRRQLAAAAENALPRLEQTVGKRASTLRIRNMTTRWGTCNTATGAITLNLQLAGRAPEFLEYVIVHELTHLHEPGHNARFYAWMDMVYPGWKQVRRRLKSGD